MQEEFVIRKGEKNDIKALHQLIMELACYEKAPDEVSNTVQQLEQDAFSAVPLFDFFVVELEQNIIGMALTYYRYSTWKGKMLYLEDFYIQEQFRRKGLGERLFNEVYETAQREKCKGMCWQVLDWNTPAINFYKKIGAHLDPEWVNGRLDIQSNDF